MTTEGPTRIKTAGKNASSESNTNDRPESAENVLRAEYSFTDEPLDLTEVDGIHEAVYEVAETRDSVVVECEDRAPDYKVYWNSKTGTVRIGAYVIGASYEYPEEFEGGDR